MKSQSNNALHLQHRVCTEIRRPNTVRQRTRTPLDLKREDMRMVSICTLIVQDPARTRLRDHRSSLLVHAADVVVRLALRAIRDVEVVASVQPLVLIVERLYFDIVN